MNSNRWYTWALRIYTLNPPLLYSIIYILFFMKSFFMLDPDFGWHLTSGEYITHHGIPYRDLYSYTMPMFPWIHHEWLADVGNYLVYHFLGGYTMLAIVYAALWTVSIWLLSRHTNHRLLIIFSTVLLLPFAGVRAITWTVVFAAVLIVLYRSKRPNVRYVIPLIMLLWANMHGSFVVGVAYLIWQAVTRRTRAALLLAIAGSLVTVITPYGAGMYTEVLRTTLDSSLHTTISEWMPLQLNIGVGIFTGIYIAMLVLQKQLLWRKLVRFESILLIMALSSVRHTVPFVLFTLPTILEDIHALKIPVVSRGVKQLIATMIIMLLAVSCLLTWQVFRTDRSNREYDYPQQIAADLRADPCDGNVFANYNYGGYLIWKVPGEKLFIDGRMPSWSANGDDIMHDYVTITKDTAFRTREFTRYNVRCVVWDRQADFTKQLQKEGWRITATEPHNSIVLLTR